MPEKAESRDEGAGSNSRVQAAFRGYAKELDARHDRNERLVKISRDVTIESKRIIFFLHSLVNMKDEELKMNLEKASKRIDVLVSGPLRKAAAELPPGSPAPYCLSFGLQELAEAFCLLRHMEEPLKHQLPSWKHLQDMVNAPIEGEKNVQMTILPKDFMLGVADYTGELMRLCINSLSSGNISTCFTIRSLMQALYTGFLGVSMESNRHTAQKMNTMLQSVLKVETTCFDLKLHGRLTINRPEEVPST